MTKGIFNFKISPERKLIIKHYRGVLSVENLKDTFRIASEDPLYDPTYNVINDFQYAEIPFEESDITDFVEFVKSDNKFYQKRKSAFMTNTPNETAFAILLQILKNESKINTNTFSTLYGAIQWLGLPEYDEKIIQDCLDWLRIQSSVL